MAQVLPSHAIPGLPKAVAQLARACRKQLPEDVTIRVILTPKAGEDHPHLFLSRDDSVLGVWIWEDSAEILQPWLQGEQSLELMQPSTERNLDQARENIRQAGTPHVIAFRNLKSGPAGSDLWRDPSWLLTRLQSVGALEKQKLLARFCPEIQVTPQLTVREDAQILSAQFTGFLLDATQEEAMKRDLLLPRQQEQISNDQHALVVSGVAGSGKSLVLLYRLRMLRKFFPKRIRNALVLTHNKALASDLQHRYNRLTDGDCDHVTFSTFMRWFGKCAESGPWREPISESTRRQYMETAYDAHLKDSGLTVEQFTREVGWLKDSGLPDLEAYLTLPRTGQGFSLQTGQREKVYAAVTSYQILLEREGAIDWHDVPLRLWSRLNQGRTAMQKQYDAIFVDEAQFCAPIWFDLLRAALAPEHGQLFFAADPTQGFLRRRQSWRGLGFDVRGRIAQLDRSYRNTREILNFASMFYRSRQPEDMDAILATDLTHLPKGPMPIMIPVRSPHDEMTKVVNEIDLYLKSGGRGGEILIIHCSSYGARGCLARLQRHFGENAAMDPRQPGLEPNAIRVLSLDAATGLESRVVFLLGAHELYEQEQAYRISDEERSDRIRQNTKRLYTAITRAGHSLFITFKGPIPHDLNPHQVL
ncbi:MAG: DEAD/DEAH box helicase [Verrucomicrobia bacterium]|nr:DEAD/DEAH box helicase [Verrucomicrobiota bacterium]MCH8528811.1 UvrD-helicase domain-containing protein [Kiritimatiellia bacterium]